MAAELSSPIARVSLADARRAGLGKYFTGKRCKRGHIAERYTSSATCVECDRARYWADLERQRARVRNWRTGNREKMRSASRAWKQANPDASRFNASLRRARKRSAVGSYTMEQIKKLLRRQRFKCANCETSLREAYQIDHMRALSRGGSNDIANIQLLCPSCNHRKHAKDPLDWARENGRLL